MPSTKAMPWQNIKNMNSNKVLDTNILAPGFQKIFWLLLNRSRVAQQVKVLALYTHTDMNSIPEIHVKG